MTRQVFVYFLIILVLITSLGSAPGARAQADPVTDMFNRINTARVAQGLVPYAPNQALVSAAERHSKDMAATGNVDHTGSDQSSYRERILTAGYGQWTFGPIVNEIIYGGTGGADIAFEWWMGSDTQRGQILSSRYREVGIAAVTGTNGWTYWVLAFGAQPNTLPAFVNDGASQADKLDVLITLTNENAVPAGDGMSTMGQALQVRLAHDDQFTDAQWQPWQPRIPFQLLPEGGEQKVYVQYRDAQGRTAVTSDTVTLSHVPPTSSPSPTPSPTATSPATDTPTPSSTPTAGPTATHTPTPPEMSPTPLLTEPTPRGTASTSLTSAPSPSPQPATRSPARTSTPRPRPSPRPVATPTAYSISLNGDSLPSSFLIIWLVLQGTAILLGIALLARKAHP